jgi:hypothetical protein
MLTTYKFLQASARLGLELFFERIVIRGADYLPEGGILLLKDHQFHAIDSLLVGTLGRNEYFVGYSTLFRGLFRMSDSLRYQLLDRIIHWVPIHRPKDWEGETGTPEELALRAAERKEENKQTLESLARKVAEGGLVVIYPDSGGLPERCGWGLGKIMPGFGSVALRAAELSSETGIPVSIVCAGTIYTSFDFIYSSVTLNVGKAIDLTEYRANNGPSATRRAEKLLRERVELEIRSLGAIAPFNDIPLIQAVGGIMRTRIEDDQQRMKAVQHYVNELLNVPEEYAEVRATALEYVESARKLQLIPGMELRSPGISWMELLLTPFVALGIVLNVIPLAALIRVRWLNRHGPIYERGYRLVVPAVLIGLAWFVGLLGAAIIAPVWLLYATAAAGFGIVAAKHFWTMHLQFYRLFRNSRFSNYESLGRRLLHTVEDAMDER